MKRLNMLFVVLRIPLDFAVVCGIWWIVRLVRPITDLIPGIDSPFQTAFIPEVSFFLPFSLWASFGFVCIFSILGGYCLTKQYRWETDLSSVFFATLFWGMSLISYFSLVREEVFFSRMMLAQAMVFVVLGILLLHMFLQILQKQCWKYGKGITTVLLFGSEDQCQEMSNILSRFPEYSVQDEQHIFEKNTKVLSDEVWQIDENASRTTTTLLRNLCFHQHKTFRFVPFSSLDFARMDISILEGIPLLRAVSESIGGWGQIWKRVFDILFSIFFLVVFSPVFLCVALGVRMSSAGGIFYSSFRVGKNGVLFRHWKFRSMVSDAEKQKKKLLSKNHRTDGPLFKIKNDPRITRFGAFLRRFSLDELPQFWNVLKGDMSLVGPRPHLPEEIDQFDPDTKRILRIMPGITGLSQVSGRSNLSFADEIRLDTFYLENWSLWRDIKIILKTPLVLYDGNGAD